jgi:mannose-6-phosphate isomerase class I
MLAHGFMASMGAPPQDASLFVSNLLSEPGPSSRLELKHETWSSRTQSGSIELYPIPMEEFDLLHLKLPDKKEEMITGNGIERPSIWIVVKGEVTVEAVNWGEQSNQAERLKSGQVVFIKPGTRVKLEKLGDEVVEAWAAFCEA